MPTLLKYAFIFLLCCASFADDPVATYSRFCATCGIWGADTIVSQSGQFIVHGLGQPAVPLPARGENPPQWVEAEPQLVALTAERTRHAFVEELGLPDAFREKIHIVILPRAQPDQTMGVVTHVHTDGFQYQLGVPGYVESSRMVKGIVQAVLQEYANRGAQRSAELPAWLVEGMTRELLSNLVPVPAMNQHPLTQAGEFLSRPQIRRGYDRMGASRSFLQTNAPLTVQDLSFNNLGSLGAYERARYESSAHFFVYELLQLRGGQALLGRFLQTLPAALNWQTAFYSAYAQYFHSPLDLEKWWMLRSLEIRNRQGHLTWNTEVSLHSLNALLRTAAEFRGNNNAIPVHREATLQQLVTSFDFGVQKDLLGQKLQQVFFISANLSPEVAALARAYEEAMETYLDKRSLNDYQPTLKSDPEQRLQLLVRSTLKTFDELDQAQDDIRAGRKPSLPQHSQSHTFGRQILVTRGASLK